MKTWTGLDAPLSDGVGEVNLLDLVMRLGRESRWGAYGSTEYKVLHHTLLVTLIWLRAGFPREGLAYVVVHDHHEAYTGDIPSPVKRVMGDGIKKLEKYLDGRVWESLGLPPPDAETLRYVKLCDLAALVIEAPLFGPPNAASGETLTKVFDPHSVADHPDVPGDLRAEVTALVQKVIPNLAEVFKNRAMVGSR